MGSVRFRPDTKRLYFDFLYRGVRCREYAALPDTPSNRRQMEKVLARIEAEISSGTFDYARTFPGSKKAQEFADAAPSAKHAVPRRQIGHLPKFREFSEQWFAEHSLEWRHTHKLAVESIFKTHLMPAFGELHLDQIDRAKVMDFRRKLADPEQKHGRRRGVLAPATINRIVGMLRMVMTEAGLRFGLDNPCAEIRRLKLKRTDIQPFSLEDINRMLAAVRPDYKPYLMFRFFTGVRSAEANGLKWKYVDFARGQVLIRETYQDGRTEYTKTDGSQRDLQVSAPVIEALKAMRPEGYDGDPAAYAEAYVFPTRSGRPVDTTNFVYRVWKPLLERLEIPYRRPYEMRHTCATLWLAAGEAPEWIARQLGHTTTEMLFRTYSRYVPNLVRRDGTAFDRLIAGAIHGGVSSHGHKEVTQ
ncbi:site-specific integrase [Frateuria edaphi]|uniref:site-specific integrase n=1 Tax=Frateuria edaphi TaxID=2898793 RepID=UPI001E399F29|nr:site-specific integrase [Frateuria edaphi]UGB47518.1 site-specific integrase [Frateuria edaphi]